METTVKEINRRINQALSEGTTLGESIRRGEACMEEEFRGAIRRGTVNGTLRNINLRGSNGTNDSIYTYRRGRYPS